MSNRNGLGPLNEGAMTGRGLGTCRGVNAADNRIGFGRGLGRGQGRGRGLKGAGFRQSRSNNLGKSVDSQESLESQKKILEGELAFIESQLDTYKPE